MKKMKLIDVAPFSGKRVHPFDGVRNYLSTGDLQNEGLSFEKVSYNSKPSRADIIVSKGDIMFAKMANTNKVLQIDKTLDGIIVSTGFSVHRPDENLLHGKYLIQFLKNDYFLKQKNKYCTGAIQSAISNTGIKKILIPIPSISEQIQIANILCKAEKLIEQRKQSITLLDEFLKSTFLEMFGDVSKNIKGFKVATVDDISTAIKDGPHVSPKYADEGIPLLSTRNIRPGKLILEELKYVSEDTYTELTRRFKPQKNDVLITKGGTTGYAKVVDFDFKFCIWVHLAVVRLKSNVLPLYFEHAFNSDYTYMQSQHFTRGIANRDLGLTRIAKIKILLPPLELQTQFATIVTKTEILKEQSKNSLLELENLYGSISQEAFKMN